MRTVRRILEAIVCLAVCAGTVLVITAPLPDRALYPLILASVFLPGRAAFGMHYPPQLYAIYRAFKFNFGPAGLLILCCFILPGSLFANGPILASAMISCAVMSVLISLIALFPNLFPSSMKEG